MFRWTALAALALAACTSYADPTAIRAPNTTQEWARHDRVVPDLQRVSARLATENQDLCASTCRLDVKLGMAGGLGAFAAGQDVLMPVEMAEFLRTDDERALILGHEWAHVLLKHQAHGFDADLEMQAECMGAMLAKRAGYDPVRGADAHRRMAASEARDQLLLLAFGMVGGGTSLDWNGRIAMVERAAATDAGKDAMTQVCGVRW